MRSRAGSCRLLRPARFLLARSRRTSMSHTDLGQPDLAALRAAAGDAEFADAEVRLVSACGYPHAGAGPLARDLARSLTEAGFTLHHCATYDPLHRLGGVCLLPVRAGGTEAGQ